MKVKRERIKIENRGKVDEDLLIKTEDFIKKLYFDIDKGDFRKISPKLFYILDYIYLEENEEFGFEFTLLTDIFKGRIEIRKIKDENNFNVLFYKRYPTKGKFTYSLYETKLNIPLEKLNAQFSFVFEFEEKIFKKGDVVLLKSGYMAIIKKYYSNEKIGIIYDEFSEEVEEYIRKEEIDKIIKSNS